ncbi:MAG: MotA/TolQ/ExbB proton channel family protein [Gammaproteobacteria bacterium]|nr:MotA/TolQ/ExbB proton channel family protein [Gammaproteobacteria bacterium]
MEIQNLTDLLTYTWDSALTLVELGGPVVAVQLVISTIGFAMVLYKLLQFIAISTSRFRAAERAIDLWGEGETELALKLLGRARLGLARDLQFGLQNLATADREQLRDELSRRGMFFLRPYGSLLRALEIVYYLSPVLGLLGTVLGMIDAFRHLAVVAGTEAGSSALANGIWEALVCTAVGLVIAIIFTALHALLQTRLERVAEETSNLLTKVLTLGVGRG